MGADVFDISTKKEKTESLVFSDLFFLRWYTMDYVIVKIPKDNLLDVFIERVCFWGKGKLNKDLYEKMYKHYIDDGIFDDKIFDGAELNIAEIVDNDIANYTSIIEEGDEKFLEVLELAEQSEYDISCETCYSFIEAISDDKKRILIRW